MLFFSFFYDLKFSLGSIFDSVKQRGNVYQNGTVSNKILKESDESYDTYTNAFSLSGGYKHAT